MARSDDYIAEFGPIIDAQEPEDRALILDGSIEICPVCSELSAYCYTDSHEDEGPGFIGVITLASCFEWRCPHCDSHIVDADSPINHPCYTHSED